MEKKNGCGSKISTNSTSKRYCTSFAGHCFRLTTQECLDGMKNTHS